MVVVIDGNTSKVIKTIPVKEVQFDLAVNQNTNKVYVINGSLIGEGSDDIKVDKSVTVIDGNTSKVIKTIPVEGYSQYVAVNQNTNKVYVTNGIPNSVTVIDGNTSKVIKTITLDNPPMDVAVNSNTNKIYVANPSCISVIDGKTDTISSTFNPFGYYKLSIAFIAVDPQIDRVYVTPLNGDAVYVTPLNGNVLTKIGGPSKNIECN